jgi:hypothetical protein
MPEGCLILPAWRKVGHLSTSSAMPDARCKIIVAGRTLRDITVAGVAHIPGIGGAWRAFPGHFEKDSPHMVRNFRTRLAACMLPAALMLSPAQAQDAAAQEQMDAAEIYQIMIGCTAYTTLAAQMAGEDGTGPNRDLSARFTQAAVIMEPQQSAENVDSAVSGAVGAMIIRQMDASKKAETDADFATLDASCKQIDTNILTPLLAEIAASNAK